MGPEEIKMKSYADLVKCLKDIYASEIVERYKFNTLTRGPQQSVASYIAALRAQAERCNYRGRLKEMLRDRLVCGVNNNVIQKRLLSEAALTYHSAVEIATAFEAAAKGTEEIKGHVTSGGKLPLLYVGLAPKEKFNTRNHRTL